MIIRILYNELRESNIYKRLSAYVCIDVMRNQLLVEEGFAQVATYPPNVKYVDKFIEAEKSARENKKGFWELFYKQWEEHFKEMGFDTELCRREDTERLFKEMKLNH